MVSLQLNEKNFPPWLGHYNAAMICGRCNRFNKLIATYIFKTCLLLSAMCKSQRSCFDTFIGSVFFRKAKMYESLCKHCFLLWCFQIHITWVDRGHKNLLEIKYMCLTVYIVTALLLMEIKLFSACSISSSFGNSSK